MSEYKLKSGNILRVIQDENAESPDYWDNEDIFLVYEHRQFNVSREYFHPRDIFEHIKALHTGENKDRIEPLYEKYYIFNVYAYIHSGINLSLNNNSYPFNDKFDVSTTGYVLVHKESFADKEKQTIIDEKTARKYAEDLIETWNQYLSGDVWGFKVLKLIDEYTISKLTLEKVFNTFNAGELVNIKTIKSLIEKECSLNTEHEELDSCWGFYGSDPKTNGMLDHINDEIIEKII